MQNKQTRKTFFLEDSIASYTTMSLTAAPVRSNKLKRSLCSSPLKTPYSSTLSVSLVSLSVSLFLSPNFFLLHSCMQRQDEKGNLDDSRNKIGNFRCWWLCPLTLGLSLLSWSLTLFSLGLYVLLEIGRATYQIFKFKENQGYNSFRFNY